MLSLIWYMHSKDKSRRVINYKTYHKLLPEPHEMLPMPNVKSVVVVKRYKVPYQTLKGSLTSKWHFGVSAVLIIDNDENSHTFHENPPNIDNLTVKFLSYTLE